jgi:hypothetical protein
MRKNSALKIVIALVRLNSLSLCSSSNALCSAVPRAAYSDGGALIAAVYRRNEA